ncbi:hypothetical protein P692DRAFT_20824410 [Suillus brevipes Sb2]|nr:hypothetical protein P692DRAFT_20824410 [Suillus brevipes Sb2]
MNASRVRRFIQPPFSYEALFGFRKKPPKLSVTGLVLRRLFEQFPLATLFPNLCVFNSHALRENSSDLSLVRKFMSPILEALLLDVSTHLPTHEVEQVLGAIPIEAHDLRELSILMDDGARAFAVLPSFGQLPKLIELTINRVDVCLTRQAITNIQQARCLNSLSLSLSLPGTSYDGGVMALELSRLERLSLSSDDLPQCTHFIRQITTRQLSDIVIHHRQPASPIEITVFMESLSTSCQNHGSFKHISMSDLSYSKEFDSFDAGHLLGLTF